MKKLITLIMVFCLLLPTFGLCEKATDAPKAQFNKEEFDSNIKDYSNEDLLYILNSSLDRLNKNKGIENSTYKNIKAKFNIVELLLSDSVKEAETLSAKDLKKIYGTFKFKTYFRNPDDFIGEKYLIKGRVLQVLPDDDGYQLRVGTRRRYDDVVYVVLPFNPGFNIIEDDDITVYCTAQGSYSYTSTLGATITLPLMYVDSKTPVVVQ
ncbi:MAG: hypothetical protein GYA87_06415 [Christensenellaceae bacterium]|nr:hypothetical protein [Christensenellaceae bacterium]